MAPPARFQAGVPPTTDETVNPRFARVRAASGERWPDWQITTMFAPAGSSLDRLEMRSRGMFRAPVAWPIFHSSPVRTSTNTAPPATSSIASAASTSAKFLLRFLNSPIVIPLSEVCVPRQSHGLQLEYPPGSKNRTDVDAGSRIQPQSPQQRCPCLDGIPRQCLTTPV